jgi:hypothetical protein
VACPVVQYFSTLSHTRHDFRNESYWTWNRCFDFLYSFVWNISHSKKKWARDVIKNVYWSLYEIPLFLSDFNLPWFSRHIFGKDSNLKFHENMSSVCWVVPYGWRNGERSVKQTDMMKLIVAFRNFEKAPKNQINVRYMWMNQTNSKTKACNVYPNKDLQTGARSSNMQWKYFFHSFSLFCLPSSPLQLILPSNAFHLPIRIVIPIFSSRLFIL